MIIVDGSHFITQSGGIGISAQHCFALGLPSPTSASAGAMEQLAILVATILSIEQGYRRVLIISDCKEAVGYLSKQVDASLGFVSGKR